ncbi:hypothetical protein ACNKHL_06215 [Shigella flexneri]
MNAYSCCAGDITKLAVDVIVNAANPSLMGGGASMGHSSLSGLALLDACLKVRQTGRLPYGVWPLSRSAGALPAKAGAHRRASLAWW